jgi:hypothetical protein
MTGALASLTGLSDKCVHEAVDHTICDVRDYVHTNGLENFWSLLKHTLDGTYVAVEPFRLSRYLDEQTYRFNNRKATDGVPVRPRSGVHYRETLDLPRSHRSDWWSSTFSIRWGRGKRLRR